MPTDIHKIRWWGKLYEQWYKQMTISRHFENEDQLDENQNKAATETATERSRNKASAFCSQNPSQDPPRV